jgi:hypothetical protein
MPSMSISTEASAKSLPARSGVTESAEAFVVLLSVLVFGRSTAEHLASYVSVPGAIGLAAQIVFATFRVVQIWRWSCDDDVIEKRRRLLSKAGRHRRNRFSFSRSKSTGFVMNPAAPSSSARRWALVIAIGRHHQAGSSGQRTLRWLDTGGFRHRPAGPVRPLRPAIRRAPRPPPLIPCRLRWRDASVSP